MDVTIDDNVGQEVIKYAFVTARLHGFTTRNAFFMSKEVWNLSCTDCPICMHHIMHLDGISTQQSEETELRKGASMSSGIPHKHSSLVEI